MKKPEEEEFIPVSNEYLYPYTEWKKEEEEEKTANKNLSHFLTKISIMQRMM